MSVGVVQRGQVLGDSAFREQIGNQADEKEVSAMPRMPKYLKEEWAFFLYERGRKKYNELFRKCERSLTFGDDRISEAVEKYHAKLLILDPMSSYLLMHIPSAFRAHPIAESIFRNIFAPGFPQKKFNSLLTYRSITDIIKVPYFIFRGTEQ